MIPISDTLFRVSDEGTLVSVQRSLRARIPIPSSSTIVKFIGITLTHAEYNKEVEEGRGGYAIRLNSVHITMFFIFYMFRHDGKYRQQVI